MSFLDEFDKLPPEEGAQLLFRWMKEYPAELCQELATRRPVLRFHSLHPGNPTTGWRPDTTGGGGGSAGGNGGSGSGGDAWLLSDPHDVRHALEWFSMNSYARDPNRYFLGIDEEQRHEALRGIVKRAFGDIKPSQVDYWMKEAIEEAWEQQLDALQGELPSLDVWRFTRDAVLRFISRYYGMAPEQVVSQEFSALTHEAFRRFVWKIHARHFVSVSELLDSTTSPQVDPLVAIADVIANSFSERRPGTFNFQLRKHSAEANRSHVIMTQKGVISNIIGAVQGFVDNAVGGTCIALHELIRDSKDYASLQKARQLDDVDQAIALVREAQRYSIPAPWLPRVGYLGGLPKNPTESFKSEASCVCAIHSASASGATSVLAKPRGSIIKADPERYQDPADVRLGFGYHRCIGRALSDRFVARVLLRIASLDQIEAPKEPQREWGWIVKAYKVHTREPLSDVMPDWPHPPSEKVPGSNRKLPAESSVRVMIRSMRLEDIKALSPEALRSMSDEEIASLTDRQMACLSGAQTKGLGSRLTALSAAQIASMSEDAVKALDSDQISALDQSAIRVLLRIHRAALTHDALESAVKHASRHAVRASVRDVKPRPYAFSLWSDAYDTRRAASYTAWPGLVDRAWTGRRLPPCADAYTELLEEIGSSGNIKKTDSDSSSGSVPDSRACSKCEPEVDPVLAMFERDEDILAPRTTLLFAWFAQWVSDSFLRTHPDDRRRNESNHEIDLCQLYGLTESATRALRSFNDGQLLSDVVNGNEYLPALFNDQGNILPRFRALPYVKNGRLHRALASLENINPAERRIFASAMERGNSSFGYTAITTLFLREHNRIARNISKSETDWDDERVFQTTRLVMIVLLMKIVMEEYINHIAAPASGVRVYRLDHDFAEDENWYRANRISLEFNLLYRWHSLIPSEYNLPDKPMPFKDVRFNNRPLLAHGLGALLNCASHQAAGRPGLHNTLKDLLPAEQAAIKMSRDYRVAPYNAYRAEFNLPPALDFHDVTEDQELVTRLHTHYGEPANIEFLVGLYAETPREGRLFGDLMTRMLAYDAFTQVFTNPLLSRNLFQPSTFSDYGMLQIEDTRNLNDVWERNKGSYKGQQCRVSFDLPKN